MKYDRQNDFRRKKRDKLCCCSVRDAKRSGVTRVFSFFLEEPNDETIFVIFFSRDLISRHIQFQFLARNFAQ